MKKHQANHSKWFLKIDFSDFFGSTNKEFVMQQLQKVAPFSEIMKSERGIKALSKALEICFLNNGLPQGTPISPMLTNLIMIPFDHKLNKRLHALGFVYTRYADDIQISHKEHFDHEYVLSIIKNQLYAVGAPYKIKPEKTRFCSSAGRNWNLGLMLNKDNKITLGHENQKILKAKIFSFLMDEKNHHPWSRNDVEKLAGQVAYFKSIQPQRTQYIITHISNKVGLSFDQMIKKHLKLPPRRLRRRFAHRRRTFRHVPNVPVSTQQTITPFDDWLL